MRKTAGRVLAVMLGCILMAGCSAPAAEEEAGQAVRAEKPAETEGDKGGEAQQDVSDWPTVTFAILPTQEITDVDIVVDELNKYLVSIDAGVLADIVSIEFGNLSTTMTLMLSSSDKPIDIFTNMFYSTMIDVVGNEQCIPLDGYLEEYPEVKEVIGENYLPFAQVNGIQYGLPIVGAYSGFAGYALRKDIAEEIGVADREGDVITLDELTEIMMKAKEANPEMCFIINSSMGAGINIDSMGDSTLQGVLMNRGMGTSEVVDYYSSEDFRNYLEYAKKWKNAGLFLEDPLNQTIDNSYLKTGVAGGEFFGGYSIEEAKTSISTYGYDFTIFKLNEPLVNASSSSNAYFISSVCQNPDAAMKMLALLYTDPVVATYVAQGIEDVHYVLDENGCSWYPEGKDLTTVNWCAGSQFYFPNRTLTFPFETDDADYYTDMLRSNEECQITDGIGFVFDSSGVYDEYSAVSTVIDEYFKALVYAEIDYDAHLGGFQQELKDAGIDKVIAAKQEQLDAFLAKK